MGMVQDHSETILRMLDVVDCGVHVIMGSIFYRNLFPPQNVSKGQITRARDEMYAWDAFTRASGDLKWSADHDAKTIHVWR